MTYALKVNDLAGLAVLLTAAALLEARIEGMVSSEHTIRLNAVMLIFFM